LRLLLLLRRIADAMADPESEKHVRTYLKWRSSLRKPGKKQR